MLRWGQGGCVWWRSYRCEGEEWSVGEEWSAGEEWSVGEGRVRGRSGVWERGE